MDQTTSDGFTTWSACHPPINHVKLYHSSSLTTLWKDHTLAFSLSLNISCSPMPQWTKWTKWSPGINTVLKHVQWLTVPLLIRQRWGMFLPIVPIVLDVLLVSCGRGVGPERLHLSRLKHALVLGYHHLLELVLLVVVVQHSHGNPRINTGILV